jgi:hypothetical protein
MKSPKKEDKPVSDMYVTVNKLINNSFSNMLIIILDKCQRIYEFKLSYFMYSKFVHLLYDLFFSRGILGL